jgi:exodeoxyribonuclease VII small subunit
MTFEESMKELESIVNKMESGSLTIDESLKAFSKGIELCKECSKELEEAKGKVTILQKQMNDLIEKPFEPTQNA